MFTTKDFENILPPRDFDGMANPVLAQIVARANEVVSGERRGIKGVRTALDIDRSWTLAQLISHTIDETNWKKFRDVEVILDEPGHQVVIKVREKTDEEN